MPTASNPDRPDQLAERLTALGKLSATLTHELNNPSSAAQRAASELGEVLRNLQSLGLKLDSGLRPEQHNRLSELHEEAARRAGNRPGTIDGLADPLRQAELEEQLTAWLDERKVPESWKLAADLAESNLDTAWLNEVDRAAPAARLADTIAWIAAGLAATRLVDQIAQSTERISELVAAVKTYSFVDRAPMQETDVHDGLESTLVIMRHRLKNIHVVRDYRRDLPKIHANAGELNQVWTNLIDNAADAMDGSGELEVKTYRDGEALVVEIIDSGQGIPPDVKPRIFEPFFTTKTLGTGMGLGLDICKGIIVERHHGEIRVDSVPGRTSFKVYLPIASTPDSA